MSYFDEREHKAEAKKLVKKKTLNIPPETRNRVIKTINTALKKTKRKITRNADELEALIYARAQNKDSYLFLAATLMVQLCDEMKQYHGKKVYFWVK